MKLSNGVRNRRIRNIFSNRKLEQGPLVQVILGWPMQESHRVEQPQWYDSAKETQGYEQPQVLDCSGVLLSNNINKLCGVMWMYSLNVSFLFSCKSTIIKIFYVNPDGFKTVQRTCYFIKTWVIQIGYDLPGRVQNKKVVRATAWRIFCNVSLMTDVTWTIIDVLTRVCERSGAEWFWLEWGADFLKVRASWFSLAPRALHHCSITSTIHANSP